LLWYGSQNKYQQPFLFLSNSAKSQDDFNIIKVIFKIKWEELAFDKRQLTRFDISYYDKLEFAG
jgi:hypothetical protein